MKKGGMENCITGLELSIEIIDAIIVESMKLLERNDLDTMFIAERISAFFNGYIEKLEQIFDSENEESRFWAATLLVHHKIQHIQSENLLIEYVIKGEINKAETATVILLRNKNFALKDAIRMRLEAKLDTDKEVIQYFEEKLEISL